MNPTNQEQSILLIDVLKSFFDVMLAVLSRPVVQRQVLIILAILIITWLLPGAIQRWMAGRYLGGEAPPMKKSLLDQRWWAVLYRLLTPIAALALLNAAAYSLARLGHPNGLLKDVTSLMWLLLTYRVLLSLLYARFGERIRPFQKRILSPLFVVLVILQILGIVPGATALLSSTILFGTFSLLLGDLFASLIVLYVFVVGAWVVEKVMVHLLPSRLNAEPGFIQSVASLTRYALLAIGILVSLGMLGLDFTTLAIVAGGLSVGVGIGLQDIVSNFVSGLVLLFEQSLRPGDVVELNGRISWVEKISLRATIVRTQTNEELIIPNSDFTTKQVINLTKTDQLVQVRVPLGVSYKSDPEIVRQLAVETAIEHPLVLADPPPSLRFLGYDDSNLQFSLRASINQPELSPIVRSDLYYMLWEVFKEHAIEIPFPQRDLNLGSGWDKLTATHVAP